MIVQMKKTALIVLSAQRKEALKSLRKLGVVHLDEVEGSGEELMRFKEQNTKLEKALGILTENKLSKKQKKNQESLEKEKAVELAGEIVALSEKKKNLAEKINNEILEIKRIEPWGNFNPEDIAFLAEKGIYAQLYEIPRAKYKLIDSSVETLLVNSDKTQSRFLVLKDTPFEVNERPAGLPPEAFQFTLPGRSMKELEASVADAGKEIERIDALILSYVKYADAINESMTFVAKDIELENLSSGMGTDVQLSWLTGFVPVDSLNALKECARENNWALAVSDPEEDDAVPTKLKNNKLVSLIYPLTDFLDVTPGYHEFDISGWFLLFFTIFFGMIFGDAGYGSLVSVVTILFMFKAVVTRQKVPDVLKLVLLLGISTVVWGTITCNWFGLEAKYLPEWLSGLAVAPLADANAVWVPFWCEDTSAGVLTSGQNLQILCFSLALLQLSVAHIKSFFKNISEKSLKCAGDLGALLQLWGMYYVVLNMVVSGSVFSFALVLYGVPVGTVAVALIGSGFGLSFIFSNYEGSIIRSILESVKNIISVLLGVVNVFSDIVSYIRLWAVGLAGAAISQTVNNMAGPMVGHFTMFAFLVLLLVFGHGLNMILNLLSVIVHGVRLNTMEFSQHLGMSWSGIKYRPFSENK